MKSLRYLIFGPAYLDITLETGRRLVPGEPLITLDQSLAATAMQRRDDGRVILAGTSGDRLVFVLPEDCGRFAALYRLTEPVLARILGPDIERIIIGEHHVSSCGVQLGGMGAGYAKAFRGILRAPLGRIDGEPDDTGALVLGELNRLGIDIAPAYLPDCPSDSTLLVLSTCGDKLAVGVREALPRWKATMEDRLLVGKADALVFCGAPNSYMAEVLSYSPDVPVMCAPAMRNVCDDTFPLARLASQIDYLTLNALEWEHLGDHDLFLNKIPVITATEGPRGSRVLFGDEEIVVPAQPHTGPVNTNRAGETYGSSFFKVLLNDDSDFHGMRSVNMQLAHRAAQIATTQACRQLDITDFAFPPDIP